MVVVLVKNDDDDIQLLNVECTIEKQPPTNLQCALDKQRTGTIKGHSYSAL